MTISNTVRSAGPYTGNGVTTVFPFGFKVFLASEIVAVRSDGTTQTTLVQSTDYTVSLNPDQDSTPGGTITTIGTPLSSSFTLTITSNVSELQGASLQNQGGFYPKVIEAALDRAVILIQQLRSIADRTLRFPISDTGTNTELPTKNARANNLLAFDANGNPIAVAPAAQSATALQTLLAQPSGSSLIGFIQSLVGSSSRTVQAKLRDIISVKDFGAVGNGIFDDTAAINSALAAMVSGMSLYFPAGNYKVTSQIIFPSGQMSYFGDGPGQTLLTYVGVNTTNDCFVFGNGTNDVNQLMLSGIQFRSNTLMTGGAGVHFKRLTRSRINDCTFGHQDGNGNFYHGVWFDAADFVTLSGFQARAQQDGMRVNGGTGGRADLFLNNGKISSSMVGLHIGGDFGGLYLETVDIINNATNVLIDRTIVNVANRETFFGPGCLIDTADTTRTATTYDGICLDVQDTDGFIIMTGTWVATCGTAIRLGASFAGTFEFAGGIIFNCFTTYGGAGNAIEIGSTLVNVVVNGTIFKNVQAKGIYCSGGVSTNVVLRSPVFQSDVVTPLDSSIDAKIDTKSIGYNTTSLYSYGKSAFGARAPIGSATDGSPAHTFAMGPSGWGGSVHMAYYGAVASGPFLNLSKSRGTTVAAHAAVLVNDALGAINFEGSDGTSYQSAGRVTVVAGTPSGSIIPGEMQFFTKDTGGTLTRSAVIQTDHHFRPGADNAYTCGASGFRWSAIWSANGTIQTSDARTKLDVSDSALGLDFINSLRPVSYRWKEGGKTVIGQEWFDKDGNPCDENTEGAIPGDVITVSKEGDRIHWGFIAQEVKSAADAADVDFGGWVLSDKNDPDSQQALRYDQFISPLVKAVQELSAKVAELESKIK